MYIIDIKRTPIGKFLGSLSKFTAPELTIPLFSYFLQTYPFLKKDTDEVIMGNVLSAGIGMNPARIASYLGGVSEDVPSYTINQVCASGITTLAQGYRSIKSGACDIVLAGGMESMSQAPYLVKKIRTGVKFGSQVLIDSLETDGLTCSLMHIRMGETAEILAKKYGINRSEQDNFALQSHVKAVKAMENNSFSEEIISIDDVLVDESPRGDTSKEKLASLNPVFEKNGTVTVGNTCPINDGAALALLVSGAALKKYHLKPLAKIIDTVHVGLQPDLMGMGPHVAINKLLKKNSLKLSDIDLFEINEAFAAQVLAVLFELKINTEKLNIYGGSIALGHPIGMTGTRIIGTLIHGLKRTGGRLGIASLCVGGGQGAAILIENL